MNRRDLLKSAPIGLAGAALTAWSARSSSGAVRKPDGRRFSVERGDPGEIAYLSLGHTNLRVYCDGFEIQRVITADERLGFVKFYDAQHQIRKLRGDVAVAIGAA